jgi:hypothetical protein
MKHNTMLAVASLLSLLFLTLHITDDIVRGISNAESSNTSLLVLAVFLYGTLVLPNGDRGTSSCCSSDCSQQPCPSCT